MTNTSIAVTVRCKECSKELDAEIDNDKKHAGAVVLIVPPCPDCMREENENGLEEGYHRWVSENMKSEG